MTMACHMSHPLICVRVYVKEEEAQVSVSSLRHPGPDGSGHSWNTVDSRHSDGLLCLKGMGFVSVCF